MILLDSDVMIDISRRHQAALTWLAAISHQTIGLPGLVAMELLQGCRNRIDQQRIERLIFSYSLYWPNETDSKRALDDYATYHLSHNLGVLDALIAETAVGLNVALVTFNQKHYGVITSLQTVQPYER